MVFRLEESMQRTTKACVVQLYAAVFTLHIKVLTTLPSLECRQSG